MSLPERELKGEEAGTVCEGVIGRGGVRGWAFGDVQHEFGPGSAVCGGSPRDDGEDQGAGAVTHQREEKVRSEREKEIRFPFLIFWRHQ